MLIFLSLGPQRLRRHDDSIALAEVSLWVEIQITHCLIELVELPISMVHHRTSKALIDLQFSHLEQEVVVDQYDGSSQAGVPVIIIIIMIMYNI